jgi:hypothetical protein
VKTNRFGIGARVGVFREGHDALWRRVHTDSTYLSANDVRVHFGLATTVDALRVVVAWPDGSKDGWDDVRADRVITLRQGSGKKL